MQLAHRIGFLRSRIARRVFASCVLCALGPLALHAWLSGREVEHKLVEQARERLEQETKTLAMGVGERVQSFAADLERVADLIAAVGPDLAGATSTELARLDWRFSGLTVLDASGTSLWSMGALNVPEIWTAGESEHLDSDKILLTSLLTDAGEPQVAFVLRTDTVSHGRLAVVAAPRIELFWTPDMFTPAGSEMVVMDMDGKALCSTTTLDADSQHQIVAERMRSTNGSFELSSPDGSYLVSYRTLFLRPQHFNNLTVALLTPRLAVLAPAQGFRVKSLQAMALAFLLVVLLTLREVGRSLAPIEALGQATKAIAAKDLSARVEVVSRDEFGDLARDFNRMAESLEQYSQVERGLYELGLSLNGEADTQRLLESILIGAAEVSRSDAACMFLRSGPGPLRLARLHGKHRSGADGIEHQVEVGAGPAHALAGLAAHAGETITLGAAGDPRGEQGELDRSVYTRLGLDVGPLVSCPLRDHEGFIFGVVQVARREGDEPTGSAFSDEEVRLVESVAAQAAVALTKNRLIEDFRELVISITEVFAIAVDEKSPYTGAHCRRVPALTMMIVESAMRDEHSELRGFRPTEEELYELRIAALMHDCGKVVTPVHVIDKATKLETIIDRIRLVELRYAILRGDEEIRLLREQLATLGGEDALERVRGLVAKAEQDLGEELEFLRRCNIGSEGMPAVDGRRVRDIAARRSWTDSEGRQASALTDDEVENLTITYGTLNEGERRVVNDHIVVTLRMLEHIKYPKSLERVPLLAGSHHERMDGSGYPRGLRREQIPWGGRIMAVADIFEALTDSDRPYKPGKSLQETLEIMGHMSQRGHIDPCVFKRFVEDEVYLRYAHEFLPPERITPVDLKRVPGLQLVDPVPRIWRSAS